ncbi:MAG: hypothetical protein JWR39_2339 [Devosia sp.]|jgi:hypothetical protein|nr:hypothetical protein [Devosia sp.]
MAEHHYIVARSESQWKVSYHGTDQGPFATKDEAVEVAIAAARAEHEDGTDVEVLVQDIESNFHTAWTSRPDEDDAAALATKA